MSWRVLLLSILISLPLMASAQSDDPEVEALYDKFDDKEAKAKKSKSRRSSISKKPKVAPSRLSELAKLNPFDDVAIIQRRFLPKSGRFEVSTGLLVGLNNAFFTNAGLSLTGTYHFLEKHGIELNYFFMGDSERQVTKDLEEDRGISTRSLVTPKSYMGVGYRWVPVYGKIALLGSKIIHYDTYFSVGGGLSDTAETTGEATLSLTAGQIFGLSKASALRWSFTWNFYTATVVENDGTKSRSGHNDLFIGLGYNFYFPEATYR